MVIQEPFFYENDVEEMIVKAKNNPLFIFPA
jgi:hypothetical protein